ncbi:MAG: hypothetical protein NC412_06365 [Roseburia sp.]|nr:hypothetical protein [Roseburia sp.]MCM1278444.1 hypothetical protein [Robinsoniella sp.]
MEINVNNKYEQFYKGTELIKNYGSNEKRKDKLVHYEFNTTDEHGNKVMDRMSREETLQAMKDIRSQYGDDVIVEFSGDGMAKLIEGRKDYLGRPLTEEEVASQAERQELFDSMVVQMENTHRMVIPNIQTNDKLYNSLDGADEEAVKAANGIIKNYLMPGNVLGMSEDERKSMIAFGMEEAKYLAENYLDKEQAGEFLSAMETIAKYGMNGSVAEDGTVTYHIEKGLNSAGQVDDMDILKEKAPGLYKEINELNQSIINHKDGEKYGARFLELHKRAAKVLNAKNEKGETNSEAAVKKYKKWEEEIEKTKLPDIFKNTKYANIQTFFESLQKQGQLSKDWLNNSMARFMKWLNQ